MSAPTFRYAVNADALAVRDLIEAAYRRPATAGQWDSEAHLLTGPRTSIGETRELIGRTDSRFLIAQIDGAIAACALIQRTGSTAAQPQAGAHSDTSGAPDAASDAASGASPRAAGGVASVPGPTSYFGMFAVDPAIRSAGLGKLVLAEAEASTRRLWKAASISLTVISLRTELIAWYERRGFRTTGARMPFPFTATSGETTRDFDLVEMRKHFSADLAA